MIRARTTVFVLTVLLAFALQPLAPLAASADPVSSLPVDPGVAAGAAAGWLALELVDGERLEGEFGADVGLTADAVFALAAAGVARGQLLAAIDWLATQVPAYTRGVPFDEQGAVYAGATAKLMLALLVDGREVRSVGGVDLVAQLQAREQADGRFTDVSQFGDFSSTLSQSLAVLALQRTPGVAPSPAAVELLLAQQCADGGFRFAIPVGDDEGGCSPSVDTTAFVVQALVAVGGEEAGVAAEAAGEWLVEVQDGSGGYVSDDGLNANSAGLAAVALALLPEVSGAVEAVEAARAYLLSLRTGCEGPAPGAVPFSADDAGDVARATTQAVGGLVGVGLAEVSSAGVSVAVPALLPFTDVTAGSTHAPAICEVLARGVVRGFDERTFGPQRGLTRAQAASVVAELLGLAPVDGQVFSDVAAGSRHAGAIAALEAAGIVTGRADGTFAPGQTIRRDQVASLLARALELEPAADQPFDDVAASSVHAANIGSLAELGVIRGTTASTFAPALEVGRDQFASLVVRAFPTDQDHSS